jgi:hypothetical protein
VVGRSPFQMAYGTLMWDELVKIALGATLANEAYEDDDPKKIASFVTDIADEIMAERDKRTK